MVIRGFARQLLVSLSLVALAAGGVVGVTSCDGSGGETTAVQPPVRPNDPAENDPAFAVNGVPRYVLAGDAHTPATSSFTLRVTAPAGSSDLDLWLDDQTATPLKQDGGDYVVEVDTAMLALGNHSMLLAQRGAKEGFYRANFVKGHALYLIISTDWDFSDADDRVLDHHTELHVAHPELLITHLIGPYTFTDTNVSEARRDLIVSWAKGMRDDYGDEIGLHIHPRCNFVEAAGVTCRSMPSVADPAGDPSGYTVALGAYDSAEWGMLLAKADELWATAGFGKPTSFRAGAWTLETHVAQALFEAGFVVDSSANNWLYMEEWIGFEIYEFNKQQWADIGSTSQPYYPTEDKLGPGGTGKEIGLLEVPDNGIMVDYWTVEEMKGIFNANFSGQALQSPTQVSTGFHPATTASYDKAEYDRLDAFLSHADQYLASALDGPVVYLNMSDATEIW